MDWAVAKCEGRRVEYNHQYTEEIKFDGWWQLGPNHWQPLNKYSTNWEQGGPIIEREDISFRKYHNPTNEAHGKYYARVCRESGRIVQWHKTTGHQMTGPTPLIAAMRCYVASKLGEEVEVPDALA